MSTYRVTAERTEVFVFDVEADSEEEARETFMDGRKVETWYDTPSDSMERTDDSLHVTAVSHVS